MATFQPRPPYRDDELARLYPKDLELQLVQVIMRHGERTPVSARFQNAGLYPHWPYCHAAERFRSAIFTPGATQTWSSLQWKRRLEYFGDDDRPLAVRGPSSEVEGICQLGELTDKGRETTHALGTRLRQLYIDRLHFMPEQLESSDMFYLRATPLTRALESLQQAFVGMYPPSTLSPNFVPPTIVTRTHHDETLYPNSGNCRRFGQLTKAFGQRAAEQWNDSPEMDYLNKKLGKWMPESSPKVAVDSHPRLSGILDTMNTTLSHGPSTRLPKEFYDEKAAAIEDKIVVEEWFSGYRENREYRKLGIGALAGDIVERMATTTGQRTGNGEQKEKIKFAISGCHDTTLAALMIAFGGFQGGKWPPYTSHIAVELFKKKPVSVATSPAAASVPTTKPGWFASTFGSVFGYSGAWTAVDEIGRKPYSQLSSTQQESLKDHYVRVRYNDVPAVLTACRQPGNHLEGDETLCTLATFKRVVDSITPKNWKDECRANLDQPVVGVNVDGLQPAGEIEDGF